MSEALSIAYLDISFRTSPMGTSKISSSYKTQFNIYDVCEFEVVNFIMNNLP